MKKIKIFTFIDRYSPLIKIWLDYYKKVLPNSSVTILYTNKTTFNLNLYLKTIGFEQVETINIEHLMDATQYIPKNDIFNSYQKKFLKHFDIVIYADHDEFIIHSELEKVLQAPFNTYITTKGVEIVHNVETELNIDFTSPLYSQRNFMSYSAWYDKPAIVNKPLYWQDGKHHDSEKEKHFIDGLYLIHLSKICLKYYLESWEQTKLMYPTHKMYKGDLKEYYIKNFSNINSKQPMININETIQKLLELI